MLYRSEWTKFPDNRALGPLGLDMGLQKQALL